MQFRSKDSLSFSSVHFHHQGWGSHQGFIRCLTRAPSELAHLWRNYLLLPSFGHKVGSDYLRPHQLQPTRLLCPWDIPGKNTGAGCHSLLQGIFPTQELNPHLLYWHADCAPMSPREAPRTNHGFCLKALSSVSMITKSITNLWRPRPRLSTVSLPASSKGTGENLQTKDHSEPRLVKVETRKPAGPTQHFSLCLSNPESYLYPLLLSASFLALLWGDQLLLIIGSNANSSLTAVSPFRSAGHHQRSRSLCCLLSEDSKTLLIYRGLILSGSGVLAVVGSLGSETQTHTLQSVTLHTPLQAHRLASCPVTHWHSPPKRGFQSRFIE